MCYQIMIRMFHAACEWNSQSPIEIRKSEKRMRGCQIIQTDCQLVASKQATGTSGNPVKC